MATRNDFQLALDVVKSVNIMNDLLDCLSYRLQGTDPNTGGVYKIKTAAGLRDPVVEDLVDTLSETKRFIDIYASRLAKIDNIALKDALTTFGIDDVIFLQDIANMKLVITQVVDLVKTVKTISEFEPIAMHIDNNIPKLRLLRREWAL